MNITSHITLYCQNKPKLIINIQSQLKNCRVLTTVQSCHQLIRELPDDGPSPLVESLFPFAIGSGVSSGL